MSEQEVFEHNTLRDNGEKCIFIVFTINVLITIHFILYINLTANQYMTTFVLECKSHFMLVNYGFCVLKDAVFDFSISNSFSISILRACFLYSKYHVV